MNFPPLKPDRCLLWITLRPDPTAPARRTALGAALAPCHPHPLDRTASAELIIVQTAAFNAHIEAVRAALGDGDTIHQIVARDGRLAVMVLELPD
jgi:hypothetical protein